MAKEELGLEITELRLGLPYGDIRGSSGVTGKNEKKRVFSEVSEEANSSTDDRMVPMKAQVVGWPPICSYRKKNSFNDKNGVEGSSKMYVKVSMDGAPFLRKIDLVLYNEYSDFAIALEKLFGCIGICKALKDTENCEYVPIYEDKDGDWMLVGDVPWEMFIESCKRLRIMKKSEAKGFGLQPRDFLRGISKDDK